MKFLPEFPLRSADLASEQSRGGPLSSILYPGLSEVVSGGWAVWRLALISGPGHWSRGRGGECGVRIISLTSARGCRGISHLSLGWMENGSMQIMG